jgi:hypothetical protein
MKGLLPMAANRNRAFPVFTLAVLPPRIAYQVSFLPDPAPKLRLPGVNSGQTHLISDLILKDYPSWRYCRKTLKKQPLFPHRRLGTKPKRRCF